MSIVVGCSRSQRSSHRRDVRNGQRHGLRSVHSQPAARDAAVRGGARYAIASADWRCSIAIMRAIVMRSSRRSTIMSSAPLPQQELRALEAFGQLLAHRVLDHARAGEADQRLRLGDHHVAEEGEARRHAAHRRIGQHADVGQPRLGQPGQRGIGLGHLHQRQQPFLHARAAGGGEADERRLLLDAVSTPRTKRSPTTEPIEPPMKSNSKQATTTGTRVHRAAHHDQRVGLAGGLERVLQALGVLACCP